MAGTILIVDDSADIRSCLARLLRVSGYHAIEAESGMQGLARLAEDPLPDLLLLDVMMPSMNGIEMLRTMRKNARTASIPVVMISAIDDPREIAAALAEGATAYWVKADMHFNDMLQQIQRFIELGPSIVPKPVSPQNAIGSRKKDPDLV